MTELVRRASALASARRRVLGIVGLPGSGKSTLAAQVVDAVGPAARNVPMDGFHLATSELQRLGRAGRKGAPDTFDTAGYVALLQRLRDGSSGDVYAPEYRRELEEPVAGALLVDAGASLVVTEGNYLLHDRDGWEPVRSLLDEVWYVDMAEQVRLDLLVERHVRFGKTPERARAWATGSDQANAELVASTRHRADLVVELGGDPLGVRAVRRGRL